MKINSSKREYSVKYWFQYNDDYDFDIMMTEADSKEEAIQNIKEGKGWHENGVMRKPYRGAKDFKII